MPRHKYKPTRSSRNRRMNRIARGPGGIGRANRYGRALQRNRLAYGNWGWRGGKYGWK